ncbi:MAG: hypothetical protein J6C11_01380 [Spirochaetaceae bacterium]|nr:hypothetical protein [Spirochaetaceae bacterium]
MLQFYFLSILLNLVTGLVLFCETDRAQDDFSFSSEPEETSSGNPILDLMESKNFKLVLGVLSVLVGLLKLLSVVQDGVPVVGDLLPAVAGLVGGFCVLLQFYMETNSIDYAPNGLIQKLFVDSRRTIGICCLVVATLHFVFPRAIFL